MEKYNKIKEVKEIDHIRSFMIYKDDETQYCTITYTKKEYEEMKYNTLEDWENFLKTSQEYFKI